MEKLIIMGMEIMIKRLSKASKQGQMPRGLLSPEDLLADGALTFLETVRGFLGAATALATTTGLHEKGADKAKRMREVVLMAARVCGEMTPLIRC
jgi:hypothetical protein